MAMSIISVTALVLVTLLVACVVACAAWCYRPHLRTTVPRNTLAARFVRERETMMVPLLQQYGLTTEMEGYLVSASAAFASHLTRTREHTEVRSRWYQLSSYLLYGMDGLLNLQGDRWRAHTRALLPAFAHSRVASVAPFMHAVARKHAAAWTQGVDARGGLLTQSIGSSDGTCANLLESVRAIAVEVLMRWSLGMSVDDPLAHDLATAFSAYGDCVHQLSAGKPSHFLWHVYALHACTLRIRDVTRRLVEAKRVEGCKGEDIVSRMAAAGLAMEDIAAELNHVHGAHKAAGFVVFNTLHELCQPDDPGARAVGGAVDVSSVGGTFWAELMAQEGACVLEGRAPTRNDIERMPVSRAIMNESLRRHVVSLGIVRQTGLPLSIDGVRIPVGTEVVLMLHAMHHMPTYWLRAYEWRPERWMTYEELATALRTYASDTRDDGCFCVRGKWVRLPPEQEATLVGTALPALRGASSTGAGTDAAAGEDDAGDGVANFSQELSDAAAKAVKPAPFCYMPFITGRRMCAGRVLAETEMLAVLHGILMDCRVTTRTKYLGHINDVPVACGDTEENAAVVARLMKAHAAFRSGPSNMTVQAGYSGAVSLLRNDNMYAAVDGAVPFVAVRV